MIVTDDQVRSVLLWARKACASLDPDAADDIAAEALCRAWQDVISGRYNPELSSFGTWARRKVLFIRSEYLSPLHRRRFQHTVLEVPFSRIPPDDEGDDGEELPIRLQPSIPPNDVDGGEPDWLGQVLDVLTEREEEVFWLLAESERPLTTREVGLAIGMSHITAGKILNSIRSKVASVLSSLDCPPVRPCPYVSGAAP